MVSWPHFYYSVNLFAHSCRSVETSNVRSREMPVHLELSWMNLEQLKLTSIQGLHKTKNKMLVDLIY